MFCIHDVCTIGANPSTPKQASGQARSASAPTLARIRAGINEAYRHQWVTDNGAQITVDGRRPAVAGNSVGGNMAALMALMPNANSTPALRVRVLFWPVTNANFENGSYDEFENDH